MKDCIGSSIWLTIFALHLNRLSSWCLCQPSNEYSWRERENERSSSKASHVFAGELTHWSVIWLGEKYWRATDIHLEFVCVISFPSVRLVIKNTRIYDYLCTAWPSGKHAVRSMSWWWIEEDVRSACFVSTMERMEEKGSLPDTRQITRVMLEGQTSLQRSVCSHRVDWCVPLICSGSLKCSNGCPSTSVGRMFWKRFSQKSCRGLVFSLGLPALLVLLPVAELLAFVTCGLTSSRCVG